MIAALQLSINKYLAKASVGEFRVGLNDGGKVLLCYEVYYWVTVLIGVDKTSGRSGVDSNVGDPTAAETTAAEDPGEEAETRGTAGQGSGHVTWRLPGTGAGSVKNLDSEEIQLYRPTFEISIY